MGRRTLTAIDRYDIPAAKAGARLRRRWRFQPRGLIGLILLAFLAINLYVLADNVVRLIGQRRTQAELERRLRDLERHVYYLQQYRDWMKTDEYLREQARSLGYVSPGETLELLPAEPPAEGDNPVARRNDRPCPPY